MATNFISLICFSSIFMFETASLLDADNFLLTDFIVALIESDKFRLSSDSKGSSKSSLGEPSFNAP